MDISGHYNWIYANGQFPILLRPNGVFCCPKFPAASTWSQDGDQVTINWGKYGIYNMKATTPVLLEGHTATNPSDWRKMEKVKALSDTEKLLLGDGGGSVWDFQWEKGSFEVEFICDSINHFVCKQFPAHSHWSLNENTLDIDWGKYGKYELVMDPASKTMTGFVKNNPSSWRKAKFLRPLGNEALSSAPAHDHHHEHNESCNHDH
jgi:hypothetical protein